MRFRADGHEMRASAVLVLLVLAGCSAPAVAPSDEPDEAENEGAFLVAVRELVEPSDPDEDLLELGYLGCRELGAGRMDEAETVVWLTMNESYEMETASAVGLNFTLLCPEWYKP